MLNIFHMIVFSICISSLIRCLQNFAHVLKLRGLCFIVEYVLTVHGYFGYKSFITPLHYMYFLHLCIVLCIFCILLSVFQTTKIFILIQIKLSNCSFKDHDFSVVCKISLLNTRLPRFIFSHPLL